MTILAALHLSVFVDFKFLNNFEENYKNGSTLNVCVCVLVCVALFSGNKTWHLNVSSLWAMSRYLSIINVQ